MKGEGEVERTADPKKSLVEFRFHRALSTGLVRLLNGHVDLFRLDRFAFGDDDFQNSQVGSG